MIEAKTIPQVVDMNNDDIDKLLGRVHFGHLGVCRANRPYVVPLHFAYRRPSVYFYTTEGLKTEIIDDNPSVCLQVEDINSREDWRSVIITGPAQRIQDADDIAKARELIKKINPKLSPAWSIRWMDDWIRSNVEALYRIVPEAVSGRQAFLANIH